MDSTSATPQGTPAEAHPPELSEQLDRINSKFEALQSLHRANRRQTLLMAALFLTVAVILIWEMILPLREIHQDPHQFMKAVENEVSSFFPVLKLEMNALIGKLVPAYKNACQQEWNARRPILEHTIPSEFSLFTNDLQVYLSTQGGVRLSHFVEKWRKRLLKDFPTLEKDEAKLAKIEDSLQNTFHTVVGLHFQKHFDTLTDIRDTVLNLQPSPEIRQLTYDQLQEHILEVINKIANDNFKPAFELWNKIHAKVVGLLDQFIEMTDLLEKDAIKLPQFKAAEKPAKAK